MLFFSEQKALLCTLFALSYYRMLSPDGVLDTICCKFQIQYLTRNFTCFLPSTGEVPKLLIGYIIIQSVIILINIYQVYKFFWAIRKYKDKFLRE